MSVKDTEATLTDDFNRRGQVAIDELLENDPIAFLRVFEQLHRDDPEIMEMINRVKGEAAQKLLSHLIENNLIKKP